MLNKTLKTMRLKPEFYFKKNDIGDYSINVPNDDELAKIYFQTVKHCDDFRKRATKVVNISFDAILLNYPVITGLCINAYMKKDAQGYLADIADYEENLYHVFIKHKRQMHNKDIYMCVKSLMVLVKLEITVLERLRKVFVQFSDAYNIRLIDTVIYQLDEYKSMLNLW